MCILTYTADESDSLFSEIIIMIYTAISRAYVRYVLNGARLTGEEIYTDIYGMITQ